VLVLQTTAISTKCWWFFCLPTICSRWHLCTWCYKAFMYSGSNLIFRGVHTQIVKSVSCAFAGRRALDLGSQGANATFFYISDHSPCSIAGIFHLPTAFNIIWHVLLSRDDHCRLVFYHWIAQSCSNYWKQQPFLSIMCSSISVVHCKYVSSQWAITLSCSNYYQQKPAGQFTLLLHLDIIACSLYVTLAECWASIICYKRVS
jgi:hypothetical protein